MKKYKKLSILMSLALLLTIFIGPIIANAQGMKAVVDDNVVISEDVDGALIVTGQNVEINGNVNGIILASGQNLTINGQVEGPVFMAANILTFNGVGNSEIFMAANNINIGPEAQITKDIFLAANNINIDSPLGRDLFATGASINLNSQVSRDGYLSGNQIIMGEEAVIGGDLDYEARQPIEGVESKVEGQVTYNQANQNVETEESTSSKALGLVRAFIGALLSALLMWLFFNKLSNGNFMYSPTSTNNPWINPLLGIGMFILIPLVILLFFVTTLFVGPGLLLLNSHILVFAFGLFLLAAHIERNYLSQKLIGQKYPRSFAFLIAYIVLYIVCKLPFVGMLVRIIAIAYVFGVLAREAFSRINNKTDKDNYNPDQVSYIDE